MNDYTLEWLTNIDRGGLFYVNDDTFTVFKAIELKTQEHLPQHLCGSESKAELLAKIANDTDIQFFWIYNLFGH